MHRTKRTLFLATFFASITVSASAQTTLGGQIPLTTAQGQFANWAIGLSTTPTGATSGNVLLHAPDVQGGLAVPWTARVFGIASPNHPNYSMAALTASWGAPASAQPVLPLFGGTSTGGDVTPRVDPNGELLVDGEHWYALNISVKGTGTGMPGSLIAWRAGSGGAGSDVFSYYPPGIGGIHPSFENTVRIEATAAQLGVGDELGDIDYGMGVISVDPYGEAGPIVPLRNELYFTLRQSWITANASWLTSLGGAVPCASTIYFMTWDGVSWSAPSIAYAHTDLFPERAVGDVEIDAISVYRVDPPNEAPQDRVVFSTTLASNLPGAPYDQILVYQRARGATGETNISQACSRKPLTVDGGVRVSEKFGLVPAGGIGPDDVDGTCGLDPYNSDTTAPRVFPTLAMALDTQPNGDGVLGLSAIRTLLPDPSWAGSEASAPLVEALHLQVSGLDIGGYVIGAVKVFLEPSPSQSGGSSDGTPEPVMLGDPFLVDATARARNAVSTWGVVPRPTSVEPIRISARIYGVNLNDFSLVELRESWFLSVRF